MKCQGLISVNWSAIDREAKKQLDLNQDGKLDVKDVAYAAKGVERYLERGLPFGGGGHSRRRMDDWLD